MVQPHLPAVDVEGELGVYVIGGEISHAVRKAGVLRPGAPPTPDFSLGLQQRVEPVQVGEEHARFARTVLARVPGGADRLLYARVDWPGGSGGSCSCSSWNASSPASSWSTPPPAPGRWRPPSRAGWPGRPRDGRACRSGAGGRRRIDPVGGPRVSGGVGHNGCP